VAAPAAKAPSKADKRRAASDAPAAAGASDGEAPSEGAPGNKRQKAAAAEALRWAQSPAYTSPACEAEARFAAALLHERAEFAKQARRCRPARRLRALHRPALHRGSRQARSEPGLHAWHKELHSMWGMRRCRRAGTKAEGRPPAAHHTHTERFGRRPGA